MPTESSRTHRFAEASIEKGRKKRERSFFTQRVIGKRRATSSERISIFKKKKIRAFRSSVSGEKGKTRLAKTTQGYKKKREEKDDSTERVPDSGRRKKHRHLIPSKKEREKKVRKPPFSVVRWERERGPVLQFFYYSRLTGKKRKGGKHCLYHDHQSRRERKK